MQFLVEHNHYGIATTKSAAVQMLKYLRTFFMKETCCNLFLSISLTSQTFPFFVIARLALSSISQSTFISCRIVPNKSRFIIKYIMKKDYRHDKHLLLTTYKTLLKTCICVIMSSYELFYVGKASFTLIVPEFAF